MEEEHKNKEELMSIEAIRDELKRLDIDMTTVKKKLEQFLSFFRDTPGNDLP